MSDSTTTVYVSGPMTGKPLLNRHAFMDAAAELRARGFNVINPHEFLQNINATQSDDPGPVARARYLRKDLHELTKADAVFLLEGWEESVGATCEVLVAGMIDVPVVFQKVPDNYIEKRDMFGYYTFDFALVAKHIRDLSLQNSIDQAGEEGYN